MRGCIHVVDRAPHYYAHAVCGQCGWLLFMAADIIDAVRARLRVDLAGGPLKGSVC